MNRAEAIKIIRETYHTEEELNALETLIPELKESEESEEERVRKDIIGLIKFALNDGSAVSPGSHTTKEEAISWLEKQKKLFESGRGLYYYDGEKTTYCGYSATEENPYDFAMSQQEKQKEQKPRKFRLGDKVHWHDDNTNVITITGFRDDAYLTDSAYGPILFRDENNWEIAKQKPTEIAPNQFDGITYGIQGYSTEKPAEWNEDWREEDIQTRFAFYTYKDEDGVLYLSNVFVEEASRNHGFGTRILRAAEKVAETIGATTISLKVKQDSPANAWYRKNGYGYVAFEDEYDWLEKNLEYMKPNKQEWSEKDEEMYINVASSLRGYACGLEDEKHRAHIKKELDWFEKRLKSFRPFLEAQQEQLPGIEEHGVPGRDFIPVEWVDACEKYGKWKIVQQEVDLEKLGEIARHIIAVKQNVEDMRLNEDEWSLLERIGYPHKLNARKEDK